MITDIEPGTVTAAPDLDSGGVVSRWSIEDNEGSRLTSETCK